MTTVGGSDDRDANDGIPDAEWVGHPTRKVPKAERRAHPRYVLGIPVLVTTRDDPGGVRSLVRDISAGGCLIETENAVAVGSRMTLVFLVRPHGCCRGHGRVVRVTSTLGFGVQFSDVNEELRQLL